ncbi:MAG: DUF3052 family protein [Candidatus Manganitrophus sp.]|nr:DUF3052 family protein [Candidatus Manganitrophus sp.]WDT72003.1 MAG: DUF3052 family protein [Candidatus Manganitrophus sp.]WDT80596.1 MAG: DUF3052 family protein [Candidatus Manganitrophus sp.]
MMGLEEQCTVVFSGRSSKGKALLETDTLLFRGDFRLEISFKTIQSLVVEDRVLKVTFPEGVALFQLGLQAEKWAEKIRNPKGLIDKLGVKTDSIVSVLKVQEESFRKELQDRAKEISEDKAKKGSDLVFLGVETLSDLKKLKTLVKAIKREGAIWTISPKGKTGIQESEILSAAKEAGLVAVKVARFSETHTANKFVIPVARR